MTCMSKHQKSIQFYYSQPRYLSDISSRGLVYRLNTEVTIYNELISFINRSISVVKTRSSRFSLLFSGVCLTNKPVKNNRVKRQNIAAQIQIKTKCMVRQKQSHELSQEKTAGSLPLIYYVMCLTFYLKIFP